ncbi:MFS transporter [Paenibacillus sp. CC-CFT747]|nr:MFS transporter [Paenibacillus sp. CC-CFT747]
MNNQTHLLRGLNFFFFATQSILLPLLPLYFALRGFTNQEIGLFMMIGPFVAVFAQPMWGYLSDRLQSIKWIIFTLWALTIASSFGLFFAAGYSATLLFVLLLYFFMLPATPLLDSLNIRMAMERGLSYGSIRMWGSVGFLLLAAGTGSLLPLFGGVANIGVMYWLLWIVPMILMLFLKDKPAAGPGLRGPP